MLRHRGAEGRQPRPDRRQDLAFALGGLVDPGVAGDHVDAGAFGRIAGVAGDLALAQRQPVEDEAGPDLRCFQVCDVRSAGEPHRSFAAQVPQDGGEVVGDVDQLLDPSGQVLLQQAGDERVDDLLQPTRQARDGELPEQRLVQKPQGLERLLHGEWQRVPDAVVVPHQPESADVGHGLVRHASALAAHAARLAVHAGGAAQGAGVAANEGGRIAAFSAPAGRRLRIAGPAGGLADADDAGESGRAGIARIVAAGAAVVCASGWVARADLAG